MYVFDAASQCCVFTLGIDACEPEEHSVNQPLVVRVGNQDVNFSETIICTASDGIFFHEHRLKPTDASSKELVAEAVQSYCRRLQGIPPEKSQQEAGLPAPSGSRIRSPRRPAPYPDAASIQQRRLALSRSESFLSSISSPDAVPVTPTGILEHFSPESSLSSASLSDTVPVMPLEGLQHSSSGTSMEQTSSPDTVAVTSLRQLLQSKSRSAVRTTIFIDPPPAIPLRELGYSRAGSSKSSTPALAAPPKKLEEPKPGPSGEAKTTKKLVTERMKEIVTNYCTNHCVGKTGYYAHIHLQNAVKDGRLGGLDFVPSRTKIEKILEQGGYMVTHVDSLGKIHKIITAHKRC